MAVWTLDQTSPQERPRQAAANRRGWFVALGVVWIVLGTAAVFMPFLATLAFEFLLGAVFLAGGAVQAVHAVGCRNWRGFATSGLAGILTLSAGAALLAFPMQGLLTLTLLLGALFFGLGVVRIVTALVSRPLANWGWMLVSGCLGATIGALIWIGWPSSSIWALGFLAGVEMMAAGWSLAMLGYDPHRRRQTSHEVPRPERQIDTYD